ncbi:MAG: nitrilase-related carbon-nitrogen hydrolase [Thermodesulfobacteriota bacterium]
MEDIRIAAVTCRCPAGEVDRNLETAAAWVEKAADRGAAIVCFPELNISGYCLEAATCRAAAGRYGDIVSRLSALAAASGIVILAGTVAEEDTGNRFFARHLVFFPDGSPAVYTKLHIAPPEKKLFVPGQDIPLFNVKGAVLGIGLCYDAHFPELATCMAARGADILFFPHASPRGTSAEKLASWMRHLPARAYDNTVFVAACNQCGENGAGLEFPGVAVALDPSGGVLATATAPDTMIIADLSAAMLETVRRHPMRYFLPGRRPDLYGSSGRDQ